MKRVSLFFITTLLFFSLVVSARTSTSLNENWSFSIEGLKTQTVNIPHTWNSIDAADGPAVGEKHIAASVQGVGYLRGEATYQRNLPKVNSSNRYYVKFDGSSIVTKLFINDKLVGEHAGAFGAFCFEITKYLNFNTKNVIKVLVDNKLPNYTIPQSGDFSMFGGIYRDITLIETAQNNFAPDFFATSGLFVTQVSLTKESAIFDITTVLSSDNYDAIAYNFIDLKNKPVNIEELTESNNFRFITNTVKTINDKKLANTDNFKFVTKRFKITNPSIWNGKLDPALYLITATLQKDGKSVDSISQKFGFRTVSIDPKKGFVLNNNYLQLKGVNRHQDKENKGWALSKNDEKQDIEMILEMGSDALRTAHYQQSENIYSLCDENGIVVWTEIPAVEKVFKDEKFVNNIFVQTAEMVLQNWNHPSIAMWGVFNEIYHQTGKEVFGQKMEETLKSVNDFMLKLDNHRFTVAATNQPHRKKLNTIPTHLAQNMYPGWYSGNPSQMGSMLDSLFKSYGKKQGVGISEYGHGASIKHHEWPAKKPVPTSYWHPEEWQAYAHELNYREIKTRPFIWGTFIWNMFDFGADYRTEGDRNGINDKGLVTYDRKTKKDAFYFYKANWNPELMVYMVANRFTTRTDETSDIKIYANGEKAYLTVNGKNYDTAAPDDFKTVTWKDIPFNIGENTIIVKTSKNGKSVEQLYRINRK